MALNILNFIISTASNRNSLLNLIRQFFGQALIPAVVSLVMIIIMADVISTFSTRTAAWRAVHPLFPLKYP